MPIVYAVSLLGGLGLAFGLLLTLASKLFAVEVDERVGKVRECLGGANCGACGFAGCDAFAEAVVAGKAPADGCPPAGKAAASAIAEIMGVTIEEKERMIARVLCQGRPGVANTRYVYDGYKSCAIAANIAGGPKECRFACVGLGDCVDVCHFDAISIVDGLARINPDACQSCGMCVDVCPRGVLKLLPVSSKVIVRCRNSDVARAARAVCMDACIGCSRCVKECKYGAIAVENGYARIDPAKCVRCGDCAAVCPCNCITVG